MTIRDYIRKWLGIDDLRSRLKWIEDSVIPQAQRADGRHIEIVNALSAINKRMVNEHVGAPRQFTESVLDWETVQAISLAHMNANPPKEN